MAQNQQEITEAKEKYPHYRWVVIGLLMFTQVVSFLLVGGIGMLLPAMRADLGFGMTESGLLASLGQLPGAVLLIPASLFLVRFSPKWVHFCSLVLAAVAGFLCGRASVFVFLMMAYCFMGAAMTARFIPDTLLKLQWIPKKELATVVGISLGMLAMGEGLGIMLIPFLLIALAGWRNLFSVYSLAVFFLAIIWMVFAKERTTPAYQKGISSRAGRSPLRGVLKRKEFLMIGIAIFGNGLAYMAILLFLPTYLLEERGMALTTIGLIVGLLPIGGLLANFVMGFVSDRIGLRKPTIWPAGLIQPVLYFALLSAIPEWSLPVLAFVIGFVAWAPFAAIRTIPFELPGIKPSEVAVGQSLIQTFTALGVILGAPLVGYLAEGLGLKTALFIICVVPLTMVVMGFLLPETGRKARPKEGEKDKGNEVD